MEGGSSDRSLRKETVIPGFGLTLGLTLLYLGLIVLLPLAALIIRSAGMGLDGFMAAAFTPRALASYRLSFGTALIAAAIDAVIGLIIAWVLVRYSFPGKRLVDAIVDLPFALPTAVAGIALASIYAENGWIGAPLAELGIKVAFTPAGIVVALLFEGLPFVVRTVEPVLQDIDVEVEEASASLGAGASTDIPAGHPAGDHAGCPHRFRARLRARPGRVRLGDLHRREPADGLGDRAASDHHQARAVRLRRCHRDRHRRARRRVPHAVRHQLAAALEQAAQRLREARRE